ncbi:MAG: type II toxin-antitoxin system RelE/ParE family toxin [archaeon]|nr:type II toxin-antitoxin system RelE/ParE family toxin [archaeon]MCP8316311.1 type II toxin-antitoxin system RelE/ParE family toxin [archaeon]
MFTIIYSRRALRSLKGLDKDTSKRIFQKIEELSSNPFSIRFKKIRGTNCYAIRIGGYRVIYSVYFDKKEIHVLLIGPRETVYEELS